MRTLGGLMIAAGLAMGLYAMAMNVGVAAPGMAFDDPLLRTGQVANWDLIGQRSIFATYSAALFVSGWVALAIDAIKSAVRVQPGVVD